MVSRVKHQNKDLKAGFAGALLHSKRLLAIVIIFLKVINLSSGLPRGRRHWGRTSLNCLFACVLSFGDYFVLFGIVLRAWEIQGILIRLLS